MKISATALFLLGCLASLSAQDSPNLRMFRTTAVRIERNIELSGRLSDPLWALAPEIPITFEIQPGENTPAAQTTIAKILYNQEYLYVGFICSESNMKQLRAHVSDRDRIFEDDFVVLIIDTYGDKQRGYQFFVNPLGIQADILRSGNNEDDSWDAIWHSAAQITDSAWTVEMAIPFKSIRFPSNQEQEWILLVGRNYPRSSRAIFSWTPFDRNNPCFLCQGGVLQGIRDIEATSSIEVLPYVVGQQSGALNDAGNPMSTFVNGALRGRVGAGIKYSPNPSLVLDAVVNPDFSQVESDASQISVNTTFALFYPEKRPFFLEGTDLFDTGIEVFSSRQINNPVGAAKLTGKAGSVSFAYLAAADRNTVFIVPGEERSSFISSSLESFSNIARARYDLADGSFFGALVTTRTLSRAHNYVGGIDWNYLFAGNHYVRGQLLASTTKEPNDLNLFSSSRGFRNTTYDAGFNGESYHGRAMQLAVERSARDFRYTLRYRDVSPTFQAHNGFVTSNDVRAITFSPSYTWYLTNALVDAAFAFADLGLRFNYAGERKERWVVLGGGMTMKSQTNWNVGMLLMNEELFRGVLFDNLRRLFWNVNTKPSSSFAFRINGDLGRYIYRSDTPQLGVGHNISTAITLKPTDKLQLTLSYSRARLVHVRTDELLFDGYIARATGVYQFSPELFVRLISEYNQFERSFQFYPLISYKLNPFTMFYVGSTHNLHAFDDPYGLQQTERQFFVKLQYLWRD